MPVVIVATHNVQYATEFDYMIVLNAGSIVAKGIYQDIKDSHNLISEEL